MRVTLALIVAIMSFSSGAVVAEETNDRSAWQVAKCEMYRENWDKALDFFGTDNVNYNFIAQNENFIASGCTEAAAVCAQSSQELEIANALTVAMMNGGAASTFLPFRCQNSAPPDAVQGATGAAPNSELCWSQIDLLTRGRKLTAEETAMFQAQCACLEQAEQSQAATDCTQ